MASPTPETLRLTLPSDTAYLHLVTNLCKNAARVAGLDAAGADQVALATDEALTNVIVHAYGGERGHEIELAFEILPDCLEIHVIHDGVPLDESKLPPKFDPVRLIESRRKGGIGIVLMRRLMDRVDFRTTPDRRNECCLRKNKPAVGA